MIDPLIMILASQHSEPVHGMVLLLTEIEMKRTSFPTVAIIIIFIIINR